MTRVPRIGSLVKVWTYPHFRKPALVLAVEQCESWKDDWEVIANHWQVKILFEENTMWVPMSVIEEEMT